MRRVGMEAWEAGVRPAEEMMMHLRVEVRDGGRVEKVLRRESVTRLGGLNTNPFVAENFGVPPRVKRR